MTRTIRLVLMLNPEEKAMFTQSAEAVGLDLSNWMRFELRRASKPGKALGDKPKKLTRDEQEMAEWSAHNVRPPFKSGQQRWAVLEKRFPEVWDDEHAHKLWERGVKECIRRRVNIIGPVEASEFFQYYDNARHGLVTGRVLEKEPVISKRTGELIYPDEDE